MTSSEAVLDPLGRILSYLVALCTIVGIPAGLYGYYSNQHDKRVEKTFELYKAFRSTSLDDDWSLLIGRWNQKAAEAKNLLRQNKQEEYKNLVIGLFAESPGPRAMERTLSFFDELSACVNNSLCDRNTAYALFQEPAYQFAGAYGPYVVTVRQEFNNKKYGAGLFQARSLEKTFSLF